MRLPIGAAASREGHAGTNLAIAPYPSTAQATTDLMTGRISIAFSSAANVLQLVEEGKLTALAVAQAKRAAMICPAC